MLGDETRNLANKEGNASGARRLGYDPQARWRSQGRTRAAGSADAAHRCRVRWVAGIAAWRLMMVAVVVLVSVLVLRSSGTAVVPLAQGHQHARVAAQRQRREQQGQQCDPGNVLHSSNLIPV